MRPKGSAAELEARRRLAVALLQDGKSNTEVARLVGAQGWIHRFVGRSDLEFFLPVGSYRVQASENGREGTSRSVVLDEPSTQARVRLEGPR